VDKDKKGFIRYLKNTENMSISAIARRVNADRKTVRKALTDSKEEKPKKRSSKLDPYKGAIDHIIADNPNITNVLILEKLKQEGYSGGRSILGEYLHKIRKKTTEAFNHIEVLPGSEAQVDWANCGSISCGEYNRKLYVFCMVLSYSRYMYISFTTSMDSDTFMGCHIKAFRFFGGIPKSLLYDNLKSVVSFRHGNEIIFNERFSDFATYYGFRIKACNVRRGNEKGKVERAIRYIKGNFLIRKNYENFEALKEEASLWLRKTANERLHSVTRKKPADMLTDEKPFLLIPPNTDYDYPSPQPLKARKNCLFTFDTNNYSMPAEYYNKALCFKAYIEKITIVYENKIIAKHRRCYDKYQIIKNPAHYAALNTHKKKAHQNESVDRFKSLCPEAETYLKGLMENHINVHYHINRILSLEQTFDKTAVAGALCHALSFNAFHWEFIKNILINMHKIEYNPKPISADRKALMDIRVKEVDLSLYDSIITRENDK